MAVSGRPSAVKGSNVHEVLSKSDIHGFVGASSLERMGVEQSLMDLTRDFKKLTLRLMTADR